MKSFLSKARLVSASYISGLMLAGILTGCSGKADSETSHPSTEENNVGETKTASDQKLGEWLGIPFGSVRPESESSDINNDGSRVYKYEPENGFRDFSEYRLFATPTSRQVYGIRAIRILDPSHPGDPSEEFEATVNQLEKEFGRTFLRMGKEAGTILSNGNYVTVLKEDLLLKSLIFVDVTNEGLKELNKKESSDAEAELYSGDLVTLALKPGKDPDDGKMHRVSSVFGVEFGKPFMKGRQSPDQNDAGAWTYPFDPGSRFMGCSEFYAFATAKSEKVFMVRACYEGDNESDSKAKYETIKRLIETATGRTFEDDEKNGMDEGCSMQFGDVHVSMTKNWMRDVVLLDFCRISLYLQNQQEYKDRGSVGLSWRNSGSAGPDSGDSFSEASERLLGPKVHAEEGEGNGAVTSLINELVSIPGKTWKISKYEVTQAQWTAIMDNNPSKHKGSNLPVDSVSLSDCKIFLERINSESLVKQAGLSFRLPSGDEWKYACLAGGEEPFGLMKNGTSAPSLVLILSAWYGENSKFESHPVGKKEPNAYGLYDMLGNVSEWVQPEHGSLYSRGGSWNSIDSQCGVVFKSGPWEYDDRTETIGFRLLAESPDTSATQQEREASPKEKQAIAEIVSQLVKILGRSYSIGKYEVTVKLWSAIMGQAPDNEGENYPVENVSWNEVGEFIEKLNSNPAAQATGYSFRLPTRSEWQHACGAGSSGRYCKTKTGEEIDATTLSKVAWYGDEYSSHPVGEKKANAFGLYDMLGNVAEWMSDGAYHGFRFICGGGFDSPIEMCNSHYSDDGAVSAQVPGLGFRICADPR